MAFFVVVGVSLSLAVRIKFDLFVCEKFQNVSFGVQQNPAVTHRARPPPVRHGARFHLRTVTYLLPV